MQHCVASGGALACRVQAAACDCAIACGAGAADPFYIWGLPSHSRGPQVILMGPASTHARMNNVTLSWDRLPWRRPPCGPLPCGAARHVGPFYGGRDRCGYRRQPDNNGSNQMNPWGPRPTQAGPLQCPSQAALTWGDGWDMGGRSLCRRCAGAARLFRRLLS